MSWRGNENDGSTASAFNAEASDPSQNQQQSAVLNEQQRQALHQQAYSQQQQAFLIQQQQAIQQQDFQQVKYVPPHLRGQAGQPQGGFNQFPPLGHQGDGYSGNVSGANPGLLGHMPPMQGAYYVYIPGSDENFHFPAFWLLNSA